DRVHGQRRETHGDTDRRASDVLHSVLQNSRARGRNSGKLAKSVHETRPPLAERPCRINGWKLGASPLTAPSSARAPLPSASAAPAPCRAVDRPVSATPAALRDLSRDSLRGGGAGSCTSTPRSNRA